MKRTVSFVSLLSLAGLLALAPQESFAKPVSAALELARQLNAAFVEVADEVSPSVVVIRVAQKPDQLGFDLDESNPLYEFFRRQFEQEQRQRQRRRSERSPHEPQFNGQGSGVVMNADGYIMTNRHVVEGAEKIKVRLKDGREFDATVRGVDAQSDIAVIKINATGLKPAQLGKSAKTRVGEFAIAIGAPFELDYSVTIGHVSAKGRSRIIPDPAMDQDFIQTDASINPGNSGGPLVNIYGEVIGINTMIRGMNTGIGFAVPIDLAREVAERLITEGKYTRAWLGVGIRALSEYTEMQPLAKGIDRGVVVMELVPNGPAAKSELKPSDIITSVDGRPVASAQELKNEVRKKAIGKEVSLDVVRAGKAMKSKVKPEAWPDETTEVANRNPHGGMGEARSLGLAVKPLTRERADQFGVEA
ncbi:MAG: trypsin-like peptidase domain-containing protein, partial [Pedosphaera parvula]|nr:trypsin-like peptidase domain-containing protein [Pedosphaera parvula]